VLNVVFSPTAFSQANYLVYWIVLPAISFQTAVADVAQNRYLSGGGMPEKETIERAQEDAREGKSPSTQAGEFVREEIHHVREGKHGVRSPKQAIAIGLSKARKAGVKLPPPPTGSASSRKKTGKQSSRRQKPSRKRSQATLKALKREGRSGASRKALSKQARSTAGKRRAGRVSSTRRKAA
jgi:uncharacterized protein DUF6496